MSNPHLHTEPDEAAGRRALLHNALQAIEALEAKLAIAEGARSRPVAVIGMACRFPGGIDSPESFWQLLCEGRNAVTPLPPDRAEIVRSMGVDPLDADGAPLWHGGFVDNIDQFDPQFFGISPREAVSMDPQQRMVLEVGWEALENAGLAPDKLAGSDTGVFLGISTSDYGKIVRLGGFDQLDAHAATGGSMNVAAGRLAFTLGLHGPCMAIDTACSSSLVAVHLATNSLRNGECRMAIAGGVNVVLMPDGFISFGRWGMTAPDGRCKTFDAAANGFVRAEGCGLLVCKLLDDALADGDSILAVIRGSAVNQDGRSSGLTVPNGPAQEAMLRAALANAGVAPADVQYVEAHGTGTAVGDPIEVEAIGAVLGEGRDADQPLFLSSVKTNLGHAESAAGVAGLIKVILCLQHREIAPMLHLRERSPRIPWPDFPVILPTTLTPWPAQEGRRIAGVSGFGFSGTNAHIVLESAPAPHAPDRSGLDEPLPQPSHSLLALSARSETALAALAAKYATYLEGQPEANLADVCFTANVGRVHFAARAAFVADDSATIAGRLRAYAEQATLGGAAAGVTPPRNPPRVAFLFTGQGSQYAGMGKALYASAPVFRDALDRCAALLATHLDRPLLDVIFSDEDELNQTAYTQPALFALEYALSELWRFWGITPVAVLGHSVGEYVAAVVAGVMRLEDGLSLIAERGRLMQALPAGGAMSAIFAPLAEVESVLAAQGGVVAVAAINGPAHTVISGSETDVARTSEHFATAGVRVQRLTVSHAFHSPLMQPMLAPFGSAVAQVALHAPRIPLIANGTGAQAGDDIVTAAYWTRHVREPVQFEASMKTLRAMGINTLVEIGPQPVLLGMAQAMGAGESYGQGAEVTTAPLSLPSLRKGRDEWQQILESLGALYVRGAALRWDALVSGPRRKLRLPTYPFQRHRYWVSPPAARGGAAGVNEGNPLLGRRISSPLLRETLFEAFVGAQQPAWLADHRIRGAVILPGTAYVEVALAGAAAFSAGSVAADLSLRATLTLNEERATRLQTLFAPESATQARLTVISLDGAPQTASGWEQSAAEYTTHAVGMLRLDGPADPPTLPLDALRNRLGAGMVDIGGYYKDMHDHGLEYGPAFRAVSQLYGGAGEALGLVELPEPFAATAGDFQIHPALLDACFHVVGAALASPISASAGHVFYIPFELEGVRVYKSGRARVWCHARLAPEDESSARAPTENADVLTAQLMIVDDEGNPVASIDKLHLRLMSDEGDEQRIKARVARWLYAVTWHEQALQTQRLETEPAAPGRWLIFAEEDGLGAEVAAQLTAQGADCVLVAPGAHSGSAGAGRWLLDANDPAAMKTLLDATFAETLQGIAYLWALDNTGAGEQSPHGRLQQLNSGALHLVQALAERATAAPRLLVATRGAQSVAGEAANPVQATLWGFGRTVANEFPALRCTLIDLDPTHAAANEPANAAQLVQELLGDSPERQVALHGTRRFVARLAHDRATAAHGGNPIRLQLNTRGNLDALTWEPQPRIAPGPGEVEIGVRATGLNFRDVLNVLGMYPGDPGPPGLECAGVVTAVGLGVTHVHEGDRVLALAGQAFNSYVVAKAALTLRLPANLLYSEAVTLPSAYLTAAYGLQHLAQLQPGERVLIHAAAGGVGIAAVKLAQQLGAEIFATASSPEKHAFLRALGVQHIYSSRTLDFGARIMADSGGAGIDVVLNSLADDFLAESVNVLAQRGRFLEIGKRGILSAEEFAAARPEGSYYPYDLTAILHTEPEVIYQLLEKLVQGAGDGSVAPLPIRAFSTDAIVDAFRFMAHAKHIGKIVLTHHPMRTAPMVNREATYLITGGLGGLGLTVARDLVAHGARHLALVGRREPTPAADAALAELRAEGADVLVLSADVGNCDDVARVLSTIAAKQPPLRGVVHAAGVVDDGVVPQQRWDRFARVFAPKLEGALHLDALTRNLHLDFFVLFSSAAALLGSPGQSNYAAANAGLDALAHKRRAEGLPALSINWGGWSEVGMAAQLDAKNQQRTAQKGIGMLTPREGTAAFDHLLAQESAQIAVLPIDWGVMRTQLGGGAPPPLLADLLSEGEGVAAQVASHLAGVHAAKTAHERQSALQTYVVEQVVRVLALHANSTPGPQQRLIDIGMDSLMAVELRNRLEGDLRVSLPLNSLFGGATIGSLAAEVDEQLSALTASAAPLTASSEYEVGAEKVGEVAPGDILSHLDEMSDDDVDALLSALLNDEGHADES